MKFAPPSLLSLAVTMSMIVLLTTLFASADSSFTAIMDGTSRPDVPALMLQKFSIPTDRTVVNSLTLRGSYYFVNFVFVDNANTCQMGQPTGSSGSFNPSEFPSSFNPSEFPSSFNPSEFPSSFNPSEFPSDFNPSEFPSSFNPSEFPSDFNPSEFPSDFNPSEFPSDFGAERKMEAQDTCPMPTTSNYSTTNTAILNYVISNLSPSILHSTGFLEIWSGNDGSEPTAMTLDLAEYTIAPRPSMGYGFTGGLGVHIQSGNILGSVCATGMLSVDTTAAAIDICKRVDIMTSYTEAAFFGGALTTGGFIAVGSLSSTLEASVYNNFTFKGDQCGNHGNDLGIICGSDVFTTSDAAMSGSTITYTVTTPNPTLVGQFIETVSLGLIPASGLTITTTTTTAVFSVKEGHMGFTKLDLDGVLQSMSPLAWSLASATDFTWDIDVVLKDTGAPSGDPSSYNPYPSSETGGPSSESGSESGSPSSPDEHSDAVLFSVILPFTASTMTVEDELASKFSSEFKLDPSRVHIVDVIVVDVDFKRVRFYFVNIAGTCSSTDHACYLNLPQYDWSIIPHHVLGTLEMQVLPAMSSYEKLGIVQLWTNTTSDPTMSPKMASASASELTAASFKIAAAAYSPYAPDPASEAPRIGHIKVQLESETRWGSVCADRVNQSAALDVCSRLFPDMAITIAAFFTGDSSQGFMAASGLYSMMMSSSSSSSTSTLYAATTSNLTSINTGVLCTHMHDISIICNSKAVTTYDPADLDKQITYTIPSSALTADQIKAAIETMTLGTIPASIIDVDASTIGSGSPQFSLMSGYGGFDRLDLDGVLQMTGDWIATNLLGASYPLEASVIVIAGTPPVQSTTTAGNTTATTTETMMTTETNSQPSSSSSAGTTTEAGENGNNSMTTTTTTTTTTQAGNGEASTTTTSGTTTQPSTTTATTTSTGGQNTTSTATTKATTTMATTTLAPKTKLDVIVEDNMTATALETAIRGIAATANASFTVTCAVASGNSGSSKKCVVEFTSSSDAAIVESEANNNKMSGVMSAAISDDTSNDDSDDDGDGNTTIIIIIVVVVVVVLVGVVAAVVIIKSRGGSGTGQSFMDMEQEMALNDPMDQPGGNVAL